jgi:hypothetical protein
MHTGWLRCSSVTYQQYAPSPAPRHPGASTAITDRLSHSRALSGSSLLRHWPAARIFPYDALGRSRAPESHLERAASQAWLYWTSARCTVASGGAALRGTSRLPAWFWRACRTLHRFAQRPIVVTDLPLMGQCSQGASLPRLAPVESGRRDPAGDNQARRYPGQPTTISIYSGVRAAPIGTRRKKSDDQSAPLGHAFRGIQCFIPGCDSQSVGDARLRPILRGRRQRRRGTERSGWERPKWRR